MSSWLFLSDVRVAAADGDVNKIAHKACHIEIQTRPASLPMIPLPIVGEAGDPWPVESTGARKLTAAKAVWRSAAAVLTFTGTRSPNN
jgi:hypothetical protein